MLPELLHRLRGEPSELRLELPLVAAKLGFLVPCGCEEEFQPCDDLLACASGIVTPFRRPSIDRPPPDNWVRSPS